MEMLSGTRVLFVITKSNWGGAQAYTYTLAKAARAAGAKTAVALGGTGAPGAGVGLLAEKLDAAGIHTIFLPAFMRDVSLVKEVAAFSSLIKIFKHGRPDIVHLNSSKAGGLGALAARIAGVPHIIFTAHGWAHREPRGALRRALILFASWLTIAFCHRVIVVSALDYRDAPALFFRHKLRLVPNGMDAVPLLTRKEARVELAERAGISDDGAFWIGAVSELHPNKGIDVLIRAFAALEERSSARLIVLGGGQEQERLTALAKTLGVDDRIHLLGFVPDARTYLAAADAYALPSRKEGLPLALLEAGLARLPVVASRVGGVPEIVMHGVTGLLVPPNDSSLLAAALDALFADKALRATLAERLHHRVLQDFSEKAMVEKTFSVYASTS